MEDMSHQQQQHDDASSSSVSASALSSTEEAAASATLGAVAHLNDSSAAPGVEHADHNGGRVSPSSAEHHAASVEANAIDMKKTGRPVHPLWAHFHRGEKRNRYHYHAFCIYCVARYGAEHVPPTRGVSIDMLRHVEKCANCPEKVVESLRDICGRRDAVRFDRYLKKKSESGDDPLHPHGDEPMVGADGDSGNTAATVSTEDASHVQQQQHDNRISEAHAQVEQVRQQQQLQQQQQQAEQQRSAELRHQQQQQAQQLLHEQQQQQTVNTELSREMIDNSATGGAQQHSSHADLSSSSTVRASQHQSSTADPANQAAATAPIATVTANQRTATAGNSGSRLFGKHDLSSHGNHGRQSSTQPQQQLQHTIASSNAYASTLSSSIKRARTFTAGNTVEWNIKLLKTAVTAGLPFQAFENTEFQQLLRVLHPAAAAASSDASLSHPFAISGVTDPKFLSEAATRLALIQLDRVKEGMHNSTIKGGLTLSINCWSTLDLQQLVAFTLVNSNGDAACVCVIDMGTQANAYSSTQLAVRIEDVLQKLEELHISVMGIVADSLIALNAARCVCFAAKRKSLLVVPCLTRQLSILAGSLLTHELFSDAVGQMIEVASYFSNGTLQNELRLVSGDDEALIPLPNRDNWYSFLQCISAMLKYCDIVTAICTEADSSGGGGGGGGLAPQRLKALVFADEGKLWKTLQELHTLLLPLNETYVLVFQHKLKGGQASSSAASRAQDSKHSEENDFLVAAHGLTLAHIMYQLARMSQQYAGLVGTHHEPLAQMMQARINITWQRYDVPVMVLAYVFNFHLDTGLLNMAHEAFQWETIAAYFQEYFSTWFYCSGDDEVGTQAATRPSSATPTNAHGDASNPALGPISSDKVHEIFSAYKMNQFPFDADTTSDYVDVSSFYSFVSDSHPEICALCCRMYAISLLSANVQRVVRGIGYIPTTTQTIKSPETVEFLLHVGFASSMKRVWPDQHHPESESSTSSRTANNNSFLCLGTIMGGCHPDDVFWNEDVWDEFASDWRQFLELELSTEEFDTITAHVHTGNSTSSSSRVSEMIHRNVPLDEVFVGTLAPLSTSGTSSSTTTAVANAGHDDTVLSMEM